MINSTKRLEKAKIRKILQKKGARIYFVGIGGISMSSLALLLKERGIRVAGSDIRKSEITDILVKNGITVRSTHTKEAIMSFNPDLVVFSLSVDESNNEYKAALDMRFPIALRSELLGAIIDDYSLSVGVSGSHGKSTVTALLGAVFESSKLAPTVLCGAEVRGGLGLIRGDEKCLVYEGCEYGDSFLNFSPNVQLLLNLELDHTDYFKSEEMIKGSFLKSANKARDCCVLNLDSKSLSEICDKIIPTVHTFSSGEKSEYRYEALKLERGTYGFKLYRENKLIGDYKPLLKGRFNLLNSVAAAVTADVIGIPHEDAVSAIGKFSGLRRRLELIAKLEKFDVFYDYAHHPSEIAAARSALSDTGYEKVAVIFAPHTYSRTAYFLSSFASELSKFSAAYITQIYGARESAIVGVSAITLANAVRDRGGISHALGVDSAKATVEEIKSMDFDCVVLMGAGEIEEYKREFLNI